MFLQSLFDSLLTLPNWPRWAVMWLLSLLVFAGCKWITWQRTKVRDASWALQMGYLFAWPGLDADSFLQPNTGKKVARPNYGEWLFAIAKTSIGLAVLFGLTRLVPAEYPYLVGWAGMVGIILTLHFGTFHLLSCGWRSCGVDARPLMNWPLRATSLSEFWGRRWNTAFRDLTHRFLFKPLTKSVGPSGAVFAGFVFSGLVHDLVISLPAGGGYGGPTLYFLLHGIGLLVERSAIGRALGLGSGWRGWLFTVTVLAAPLVLLFHPPFVTRVINPFLLAIGAIQ